MTYVWCLRRSDPTVTWILEEFEWIFCSVVDLNLGFHWRRDDFFRLNWWRIFVCRLWKGFDSDFFDKLQFVVSVLVQVSSLFLILARVKFTKSLKSFCSRTLNPSTPQSYEDPKPSQQPRSMFHRLCSVYMVSRNRKISSLESFFSSYRQDWNPRTEILQFTSHSSVHNVPLLVWVRCQQTVDQTLSKNL